MIRQLLRRNVAVESRRFLSSSTASLSRDQPLKTRTPSITCIATSSRPAVLFPSIRCYATATKKATPAKAKASTRTSKTASTKPKPKTQSRTKKTTSKKKAAAKPKAKKTTKKAAPKRSELQLKRAKVNELRKAAMLDSPKKLPTSSFTIYSTENIAKGSSAAEQIPRIAQSYRNLSTGEKERLESVAGQNREANERTDKRWIEKHTPWEIRVANNARRHLNRIAKEPLPQGAKTKLVSHATVLLNDSRKPPKSDTPYIAFSRERWGSGDFKNVRPPDASRSISSEWRSKTAAEKQKYHDVYKEAQVSYAEEYNRVYGDRPQTPKKTRQTLAKTSS